MLSPSITAQQPITPTTSRGGNQVHFEFPPDLAGLSTLASEQEASKENDENYNQAMVPSPYTPRSSRRHLNPLSPPPMHFMNKIDVNTLATRSTLSTTSMSRDPISNSTPDINPKVAKYKQQRKQIRIAATAGGMVVGGLTLGPAGIAVGAGVGAATNKFFKHKEKKAQRKHEQHCFQQAASRSVVARQHGALC